MTRRGARIGLLQPDYSQVRPLPRWIGWPLAALICWGLAIWALLIALWLVGVV